MKIGIVLGLLLSLLMVATLPRRNSSDHPLPGGEPGYPGSLPVSRTAIGRHLAFPELGATRGLASALARLLAAIKAETDPDRRSEALEQVVESVAFADLTATLDSLARDASPEAVELHQLLIRRWAESDAAAAAAWAVQLPENPLRQIALEHVAIAWANSDLPSATAWAQGLPEDDSRAAVLAVAYEAVRSEPLAALELARGLAPSRERDDFLVHAISQWAGADAAAAATWAAQVSNLDLRQRLVASVAVASAEQNGAGAATLAANALEAGDEQDRAVVCVVKRWAQAAPEAAASWVSRFPDVPLRGEALQNVLILWVAQDPEAAGNWLDELPAGPLREVGIRTYALILAKRNRGSAPVAPNG